MTFRDPFKYKWCKNHGGPQGRWEEMSPSSLVAWHSIPAEEEGLVGLGAAIQGPGGVTVTTSLPSSLVFLRLAR